MWHIQFSHDGRYLASASKDCTARVWEVLPGGNLQLLHTLDGHHDAVAFVCWSPDDSMLLTCGKWCCVVYPYLFMFILAFIFIFMFVLL